MTRGHGRWRLLQCCSVHLDENSIKSENDGSFLPFLNFPSANVYVLVLQQKLGWEASATIASGSSTQGSRGASVKANGTRCNRTARLRLARKKTDMTPALYLVGRTGQ